MHHDAGPRSPRVSPLAKRMEGWFAQQTHRIARKEPVTIPVPAGGYFRHPAEAFWSNKLNNVLIRLGWVPVEHRRGGALTSETFYPRGDVPFGAGPGRVV